MTVELEIPSNTFVASEDDEFLIDFYIYDKNNIQVILDGVLISSTRYTVLENTEANSNGSRIVFDEPISGVLVIKRVTTKERTTSYSNVLNNIIPSTLNNDFDRVWRVIQELGYSDTEILNKLDQEILSRIQGDLELRAYIDSVLNNNGTQILDTSVDLSRGNDRTQKDKNIENVHIRDFGAISDGEFRTLQHWINIGRYDSLSDIQVDYPFVESLDESVDYVGIQAAINYLYDNRIVSGTVHLDGCSLVNREIIIRHPLTIDGHNRCSPHACGWNSNRPLGTSIVMTGDDASMCRTVKTRRKYRGNPSDPQDDPINAGINIQAHSVSLKNFTIQNDQDPVLLRGDTGYIDDKIEPTIVEGEYVAPNYYGAPRTIRRSYWGADWDVGVFIGARYQKNLENVGIYCFRKYGLYQSSADQGFIVGATGRIGCAPLKDWRGNPLIHLLNPFKPDSNISTIGADGLNINNCHFLGNPVGVALYGPLPKPGLSTYGRDLKRRLSVTFTRLPIDGEELELGFYDVTILDGVGTRGEYRPVILKFVNELSVSPVTGFIEVLIRGTIEETVSELIDQLNDLAADTTDEETDIESAGQFDATLFFKGEGFGLDVNSLYLSAKYYTTSPTIRFLTGTTIKPNAFISLLDGVLVSGEYIPTTTVDPAPYCWLTGDETVDELSLYGSDNGLPIGYVEDNRGLVGMSDQYISNSFLYSLKHRSFDVKQIDTQRRVHQDIAGACIHIDGIAGNGARKIQKMSISNCRIDTKGCSVGIRLGYSNLVSIINCIPDGYGTGNLIYRPLSINYYGWISRNSNNGSIYVQGLYRTPLDTFSFKGRVVALGSGRGIGRIMYLDGRVDARGFIADLSDRFGSNPYLRLTSGDQGSSTISLLRPDRTGATLGYYTENDSLLVNNANGGVTINAKADNTITHKFNTLNTIVYHPDYAEPQYFYDLGTNLKPFNKVYAKEFIVSVGEGLLGDFWDALDD